MTPVIHTPNPINSYLVTISPKNKNAINAANIGDVLLINASFDREINYTATLNMKNVIVPVIALIITNLHWSSGTSSRFTLSCTAIIYDTAS